MRVIDKEILASLCLRKKDLPFPEELIFEPTSRCNFRCKMCFYDSEYFKIQDKEMGLPEIEICISNLPRTIKRALLIGGEPLLRKDIVDIVRLFSQKKIKVAIVTNGYLLTPVLTDELNKIGNIDKIAISLDGPPEINNKIRGVKDAFERSYANLKYAANYFNTEVVSVLQDDNEAALHRLLPYLKEIPNVVFIVEIMRKYTRQLIDDTARILHTRPENIHLQASDIALDNRSVSNILSTLFNIKRDAIHMQLKLRTIPENAFERIPNLLGKNEGLNHPQICGRLPKVRLDSVGNIIQCYAIRKPLGSLLEKKLEEIWNSEDLKNFRKEMVEKNLFPVCSLCFAVKNLDIKK
ncbi:MAG: radical SAM protein [Candidatus Omnitrophica bacterium]|nr:radical SAM protein [Candidatus Omnitrophota bacterium]